MALAQSEPGPQKLLQKYREDRRLLLEHILSRLPRDQLLLPPNVTSIEQADLDHVNVRVLLKAVQDGKRIDLASMTLAKPLPPPPSTTSTRPPTQPAAHATPPSTPPLVDIPKNTTSNPPDTPTANDNLRLSSSTVPNSLPAPLIPAPTAPSPLPPVPPRPIASQARIGEASATEASFDTLHTALAPSPIVATPLPLSSPALPATPPQPIPADLRWSWKSPDRTSDGSDGHRICRHRRRQLALAAYETLLLCTAFGENLSENDRNTLHRHIRPQFRLSTADHAAIIARLRLPPEAGPPGVDMKTLLSTANYRWLLIKHAHEAGTIDNAAIERDAAVLFEAAVATARTRGTAYYTVATPTANGIAATTMSAVDILTGLQQRLTEIVNCSQSPAVAGSYAAAEAYVAAFSEPVISIVHPLSTKLYEQLLSTACFTVGGSDVVDSDDSDADDSDDDILDRRSPNAALHTAHVDIVATIGVLRRILAVSNDTADWVWRKVLLKRYGRAVVANSRHLPTGLLTTLRAELNSPSVAASAAAAAPATRGVIASMATKLRKLIVNFQEYFSAENESDREDVALLLELSITPPMLGGKDRTVAIVDIMTAAANATHAALLPSEHNVATFARLLDAVADVLRVDTRVWVPLFARFSPNAASAYAAQLGALYCDDVGTFFASEAAIYDPAVALLWQRLVECDKLFVSLGATRLPDIVSAFKASILRFIELHEERLSTFVDRALMLEKWKPGTGPAAVGDVDTSDGRIGKGFAGSVIDVFSMLQAVVTLIFAVNHRDLIELFVGMFVQRLVCDTAVRRYVAAISRLAGNFSAKLVPASANRPPSSLAGGARKKLARAYRSAVNEIARTPGSGIQPIPMQSGIPPLPGDVAAFLANQPLEALFVRLNSIAGTRSMLVDLVDELKARVAKVSAAPTTVGTGGPLVAGNEAAWRELYSAALSTVDKAADEFMQFIANVIVYYDFREEMLENLYVPTPAEARIDGVLEQLDNVMRRICEDAVVDALAKPMAAALCRAMLKAFEYVLLHGGSLRVFEPKDADIFVEDLLLIQKFFIAKDSAGVVHGLPEIFVTQQAQPIRTVIASLFEEPTATLVDAYDAAPVTHPTLPITKSTIMCVLLHRKKDKEARKFIKQHFKAFIRSGGVI